MIITTISCLRVGGGDGQHANPAEDTKHNTNTNNDDNNNNSNDDNKPTKHKYTKHN